MIIFPAIDLRDGKCVRLTKGDFNTTKVYNENPHDMLSQFKQAGATWVHIVDLDGAKQGSIAQASLINDLLANNELNIEVGGGVRTEKDLEILFNCGVNRVIVGSVSVSNRDMVYQWIESYGADKIVLALDCQFNQEGIPVVKTHGWQADSQYSVWDLLDFYSNAKYILCTDISVDGMLTGPSIELYKQIQERYPHLEVIASGGVGSYSDLEELKKLGVYGVVVGKAIYEGKVELNKIF